MNNRFNLKQNFVQYIGLTKALQNYMKLLKKQLFKNQDIGYLNKVEIFCRSKRGYKNVKPFGIYDKRCIYRLFINI